MMEIEQRCIAPGCEAIACFGMGDPRKPETMRWACMAHRKGLDAPETPPSDKPEPPPKWLRPGDDLFGAG